MLCGTLLAVAALGHVTAKLDTDEDGDNMESAGDDQELMDSSELLGPAVTQVYRHPYAASITANGTYICSAVILNTYWLVTQSKCFNSDATTSYVMHNNLKRYSVRVGSSYNTKGGILYPISTLINNFDQQITVVKLGIPLVFNSNVRSVRLPQYDEDPSLGYLASIMAWTPSGHIRTVNVPVIEASICDTYTKLLPGHYICVGGVQDPNRHFCRQDDGGAVVQNDTLIGISSFLHTCAIYSRSHAFPKVSSFARWLDTVIWDENNRPTKPPIFHTSTGKILENKTENPLESNTPVQSQFYFTLPFDPINVPIVPQENNFVMPRMSLYESYLWKMSKMKTSTTVDPLKAEEKRRNGLERAWMQKFGLGLYQQGQYN